MKLVRKIKTLEDGKKVSNFFLIGDNGVSVCIKPAFPKLKDGRPNAFDFATLCAMSEVDE